MRIYKRLMAVLLAVATAVAMLSVSHFTGAAGSNIVIGGIDIGYAHGDFFTKNSKTCENDYWYNGICHGNGVCTNSEHKYCNCMRYWPTGKKETCEVDLMTVQCHGFARYCQYALYGYHEAEKPELYTDITGVMYYSECTTSRIKEELFGCAPATHIRTLTTGKGYPHSICVISTSSSGARIAECNADGRCEIKERTLTWETFAKYIRDHGGIYFTNACKDVVRHNLVISYNANGAAVKAPDKTFDKYKVVITAGVNMRSGAGTNYGAVCTLPYNAVFVVTETKKANGYIWGKTSYGGKSGWCVISEGWTAKVGSDGKATYCLDSKGFVCRTSDSLPLKQKMLEGITYENGLYDCATLGLYCDDCRFLGWGTEPDGGVIFDQKAAMTADKLYPAISEGNGRLTLYAIFSCKQTEEPELDSKPSEDTSPDESTNDEMFASGSGDVNIDGEVNIKDATAIQKHLALIEVLSAEALAVADCDGDKGVTIKDVTAIQKKIAQLI